jgi:hypothetical protein
MVGIVIVNRVAALVSPLAQRPFRIVIPARRVPAEDASECGGNIERAQERERTRHAHRPRPLVQQTNPVRPSKTFCTECRRDITKYCIL